MTVPRALIEQAGALGPLPATATKLAAALADPAVTIDGIATIIQYDQAITADVLRMANAAAFAPSRAIVTLREAVIRLGGGRILEWVVASHVRGRMRESLPAYGYSEQELWRHSIAAALAAEGLSSLSRSRSGGVTFTAALLHDIGKLVLGRGVAPGEMQRIWTLVAGGTRTCEQAEREVLGFSHAEVGADLARAWKLPDAIVTAIGNHHRVDAAPDPVTDSVAIANLVARSMGEGIGHEGMSLALSSGVIERSGLTRESLERLCAETAGRMDEIMSLFKS